jgi:hypothetical protein
VVNAFAILGPMRRTPRVRIDDLVVARASWRFAASELPVRAPSPFERFLALRAWAKENALPRFVFARVPHQPKPMYVDFDAPAFVDLLWRAVKEMDASPDATVHISEMLPGHDHAWFADAAGKRYFSELRIVFTDERHLEAYASSRKRCTASKS